VKQVLQDRSGLTVVRDVPPPTCARGAVLVRNSFSAISSGTERARVALSKKSLVAKARERPDLARQVLDRARREGILATHQTVKRKLAEATPVGYSSAGEILELGAGVLGFEIGDRVACAGGGHANHAEIVSVPTNLCAKVPDGVSLEAASLTTVASIALHGIRLADARIGDRVAVVGSGLVGQLAVRLLQAGGVEVVVLDIDPTRVQQARLTGAAHAFVADGDAVRRVLQATGGVGVDAVLVTAAASSNEPLLTAAAIARDRGTIVLVGAVPIDLPRTPLYDKELLFRVSRSYGPGRYDRDYEERGLDYPIGYVRWTEKRNMEAIHALQASGRLQLDDLIDEIVPVEEAARAYERLVAPAADERPQGALLLSYGPSRDVSEEPVIQKTPEVATDSVPRSGTTPPVRIGLIGPGSFALRVLVPAFARAGARLELVGGGAGPSAESAQREFDFARIAPSATALLADEGIDAVVIATRHSTHAELTIQALGAGKHVFCEKPLVLNRDELEAVLSAAARAGRVLAVGFNRRFSPMLSELRDFVAEADGSLSASYRVSAGQLDADHWVHDVDEGGGRLLGEGGHFVDSLTFLAGAPVERVYAAGYGAPELPVQARDNVAIELTFSNGSIGTILYVSDGSARVPKERIEAFAGNRTAILDDYRALEFFGPSGKREARQKRQEKGHRQEVEAFLRAVEHGEPPVPFQELANVSLATLAAVESLRTGRPVRLAQ
jgi:predicted dehydrogenase/threonine dehydrogenase-like Zn-dependent dehydrogenase